MHIPDEKLEGLRQALQSYSKEPVVAEDARNLVRFFELLMEADKKAKMNKDESSLKP